MISFPNAKINIGLDILEKRMDGYHNISTCFYPIPLCDVLEFVESDLFSFRSSGLKIPGNDQENLVISAYKLLQKDFQLPAISIHLHKNIPAGSGMGGGSSNAAFMLVMINDYFKLFLDDSILAEYAFELSSDCPFFIYNRPMTGSHRGEVLEENNIMLEGYTLIILKPQINISTHEAYSRIIPLIPAKHLSDIIGNMSPEEWKGILKNDFEPVLFKQYPVLAELRDMMYNNGAVYASMTGSGAAVYGLFKSNPGLEINTDDYFVWGCKF